MSDQRSQYRWQPMVIKVDVENAGLQNIPGEDVADTICEAFTKALQNSDYGGRFTKDVNIGFSSKIIDAVKGITQTTIDFSFMCERTDEEIDEVMAKRDQKQAEKTARQKKDGNAEAVVRYLMENGLPPGMMFDGKQFAYGVQKE
jgi:hypothetical protein